MAERKALFIYTLTKGDFGLDEDHPTDMEIIFYETADERRQLLANLDELDEDQARRGFRIDLTAAETLKKAHDGLWNNLNASLVAGDESEHEANIDRAWVEMLRSFRESATFTWTASED